ncbi:nucleotidyltransferase domain-containing protein [Candidatus Pacearchaeota archaeon]|nr:nucleotidyltransferase domain-containing protein [Candidatus Pacearchaeota archaeon]
MDKLIEIFLEEPEKEFYVRELSRNLKKSPTTISKYLKELEKKGILDSEKKFNHLFFKANTEKEAFKQLKINYNLKKIKESGIISFLAKEFNEPRAVVLFGSFAKGEDIKASDIDLLVITPLKKEINLEKFEDEVGHKIQLFLFSNKELEKMKEENKELLNSFINGAILYGFVEMFK